MRPILISFGLLLTCMAHGQSGKTMKVMLADGFDHSVNPPNAEGYYKFRGYSAHGHMGEDWNGRGGGNSDMGDPIRAIARGIVVYSANAKKGWGNCVIVRHAYREHDGKIRLVDSLYAHLQRRDVKLFQYVERGQQVGAMGDNFGMYYAHLHLELRKNIYVGMHRMDFAQDDSIYYSPTAFIEAHRTLENSSRKYDIPVETFKPYGGDGENETAPVADSDRPRVPSLREGVTQDVEKGLNSVIRSATPAQRRSTSDFWNRLKRKIKGTP